MTWQGQRKIEYSDVPDPVIQEPTDAIIEITSSGICGSDLHLYEVMGPYLAPGDVLEHEPTGIVVETGSAVPNLKAGDRVVVPFGIAQAEYLRVPQARCSDAGECTDDGFSVQTPRRTISGNSACQNGSR